MRRCWQKCAIAATIFSLLFFCPGAFAASILESGGALDFTYDMRSMIRLNPDFSTFPDTNGIIWLKQLDYRSAPNGGIERRSLWIILGRQGLQSRWLNWNIPAPQGGCAEILQASVYSPASSQKIMDVTPVPFSQNGVGGQSVSFTGLPDEYILVVSYRELFAERLSIDDLVWINEPLPVWEQLIGVTVPTGHPFYYDSNPQTDPKVQTIDDRKIYEWRIINTAASAQLSLRTDTRGYIAFGMREGRDVAARFIKNLESPTLPLVPAAAARMIGKGTGGKGIEDLLKWLYRQPTFILPDCTLREIPAEAPWTSREKLLVAYGWLKNAGADVRLFWRLAYQPESGKPACESLAMSPVLEISALDSQKGSVFYCDMETPPRFGETPHSLQGLTLYGVNTAGKIEERKVPGSSATENRLGAVFDLNLGEDGMMGGTIRLQLRGAWRHFLLPPDPSNDDLASLVKYLFPALLRYSDIKLKAGDSTSEITVTLSETQSIKGTGGRNILVALPSLIPGWFASLSKGPYPYTLDFPFAMDAKVTLALPGSVANVMLPTPTDRNLGKIKYTESWKWNKKRLLSAEAHMTVPTTSIEDDTASGLNSAFQSWHLFMTKNLPVQLKVKK